jgi:hypothetical protein
VDFLKYPLVHFLLQLLGKRARVLGRIKGIVSVFSDCVRAVTTATAFGTEARSLPFHVRCGWNETFMCGIHRLRKRCVGEIRDKCNEDGEVEVDLKRRDEGGGEGNTGAESTSCLIAPRSPNFIESPMLRSDSIVSAILGSFPLSSVASGSIRVRRKTISGWCVCA